MVIVEYNSGSSNQGINFDQTALVDTFIPIVIITTRTLTNKIQNSAFMHFMHLKDYSNLLFLVVDFTFSKIYNLIFFNLKK